GGLAGEGSAEEVSADSALPAAPVPGRTSFPVGAPAPPSSPSMISAALPRALGQAPWNPLPRLRPAREAAPAGSPSKAARARSRRAPQRAGRGPQRRRSPVEPSDVLAPPPGVPAGHRPTASSLRSD